MRGTIAKEYKEYTLFPKPTDWFRSFEMTDPNTVKVVILGQDPYPNDSADGLAFSTKREIAPYSLRMMQREVDRDILHTREYDEFHKAFPTNRLDSWAKQGVLLLNPVLTVRDNSPGSHKGIGWETFTSVPLAHLYNSTIPRIFVTWGKAAKEQLSDAVLPHRWDHPHLFLEAGHPAAGAHGKDTFSGCGHFSKVNQFLIKRNQTPIDWTTRLSD